MIVPQQITSKHILATTGYPTYYFPWVEIEKGIYAWDGSLLSNTPLREVIDASPVKDKRIYLVENDPKNIDKLPDNLQEVKHITRDITFSDKTLHNIQMSKTITYYLRLMSQDNAGVVVDYILSMKYEANLSDNYRRNLIRIGTYNIFRTYLVRFFKRLYYPEIPPNARPKPAVIENIGRLKRKEISIYKPTG